jgi:signal transduction histidine kinase
MASLGLLAAGVAHEINNPAGFIYSNVDLLRGYMAQLKKLLRAYEEINLPPDAAAGIERVRKQMDYENIIGDLDSILSDCHLGAERIRDVVQNLSLFSRLNEAEIKLIDLHEAIDATVRLLSSYYKSGQIILDRDYGDLPLVNCCAAQLNQVWMNLLVNAAQAIGNKSGKVRIQTRCHGSTVTVSFMDTGGGISSGNLEKIFDPFFTTKSVGEGTGLGLSISHQIIAQHRGTIEVRNDPTEAQLLQLLCPSTPKRLTRQQINFQKVRTIIWITR